MRSREYPISQPDLPPSPNFRTAGSTICDAVLLVGVVRIVAGRVWNPVAPLIVVATRAIAAVVRGAVVVATAVIIRGAAISEIETTAGPAPVAIESTAVSSIAEAALGAAGESALAAGERSCRTSATTAARRGETPAPRRTAISGGMVSSATTAAAAMLSKGTRGCHHKRAG